MVSMMGYDVGRKRGGVCDSIVRRYNDDDDDDEVQVEDVLGELFVSFFFLFIYIEVRYADTLTFFF